MSRHTTTITVQDVPVTVMQVDQSDYISLTDMAKARTDSTRAADVIKNWLRTRSTLEFLGTWEVMYNPDFKVVEFDHFKNEAGLHTFTFNHKDGAQTITLGDIETALAEKENGSDLVSSAVPKSRSSPKGTTCFLIVPEGTRTIKCGSPVDFCQTPAGRRLSKALSKIWAGCPSGGPFLSRQEAPQECGSRCDCHWQSFIRFTVRRTAPFLSIGGKEV